MCTLIYVRRNYTLKSASDHEFSWTDAVADDKNFISATHSVADNKGNYAYKRLWGIVVVTR